MSPDSLKKNFKDNLYFDETHQRKEISFRTYNLEILSARYNQGWSFKKIKEGFLIRAPEEWLVDLTDPYKILFYEDAVVNLACYDFLKDLIAKDNFDRFVKNVIKKYHLKGFEIQLLQGPGIESEIRVAGSDNRAIQLRELLFSEVENNDLWQHFLNKAKGYLGSVRKMKSFKVSIQL